MVNNTLLNDKQGCTQKSCLITLADLPFSCPPRDSRIWDAHPRVYLPIEELGQVRCPYCGTDYILEKSSLYE